MKAISTSLTLKSTGIIALAISRNKGFAQSLIVALILLVVISGLVLVWIKRGVNSKKSFNYSHAPDETYRIERHGARIDIFLNEDHVDGYTGITLIGALWKYASLKRKYRNR